MKFSFLDYLAIALFFAVLLLIPAVAALRTKSKDSREYFKSAGSMPWWLIGVSMVAATTSTNSANLFTEIIRRDGMSGNWVWWAFLLTGMLTVFVYSRLWVRSGAATDIAFYELRYSGRPAAFLRGFRALYLGVIYNLVVMATVLLGAIKIGVVMFGVSAWTVLAVTAVASLVYSCLSGIRGTIYTDFFLFAVVMVGALAVMYYGVNHPSVGGWSAMMSSPAVASRLSFIPEFSKTDAFIAVFVIPVAVQWWNVWYSGSEPGGGGYIVQRMLTAKSQGHALGGTLFFNVLNYALRPWPWYIAAFASILIFPDLDSIRAAFPGVDPSLVGDDMAYPAMIKVVPHGWIGVVAASLMGALFSTIAAQLSMGANYVTNDIWKRFVRKGASDREMIFVARVSSVALMLAGCALAPLIASAKSGFDLMVQVGAGTGIIFLLRWFWMRINAWSEIVAMSVSFLCAVFFQIVWPHISDQPLLFWQKLLWTIAVTTVVWMAATFATSPESAETVSRFRELVRAKGRDVGMGVLLTFLSSVAIFGFMALVTKIICFVPDAHAAPVCDCSAEVAEMWKPTMVAHRGAGDLTMPEASLPAYSNAVATACGIVKLDLRCTKDGVIVMGHDATLKRNMGWDVEISSLDYAEILEKGRFLEKGKPGQYRIVRLDEALAIARGAPELWLDFKNFSPEMAERVLKEAEKAGIGKNRLMVATFSKRALAYFRDHCPEIRRVGHYNFDPAKLNGDEMRKAVLRFKEEYGLYGVNMPVDKRKTSPEDVSFLKENGLWVSLWYIQNEKEAAHYLPARPNAFVTDHVSTVRQALTK